MSRRPRVLYILSAFPQISETYMKAEIEALSDEFEIRVISRKRPDLSYRSAITCRLIQDPAAIREAVEEFRPDVLHTHWLTQAAFVCELARETGVPFTVRAHSFDTACREPDFFERLTRKKHLPSHFTPAARAVNDELCLGLLTFPYTRSSLERAGFRAKKIHECRPALDYRRFHDRSPNGVAVMNTGACLPKKGMENFLGLAKKLPGMEFNLYATGYKVESLKELNERMGRPVKMWPPVEPDDMPAEYKKHRWLVYTAEKGVRRIGWSVSVAEAQASGVGVCFPDLGADVREYVGDCGFLYRSLGEVADIIRRPFPEEMREAGFEQAKKSDIHEHKSILTDLWRRAFN